MALKSNKTTLAVVAQSAAGTFDAPSSTDDVTPISNLSFNIAGVTVENQEYTGSIHKNGPDLAGKRVDGSFMIYMRPPGGASVPAAGDYIPGRFLTAAKFSEVRTTTAIPAAAEAVAAGTTTTVTLGAGAAATADLYKGLALHLSDNGATFKEQLTAITAYTAGKLASLPETLSGAPAANYQIPPQLSYQRSIDETDAGFLSVALWLDGVRYDLVDFRVSSLRLALPVSTRDNAAQPMFEIGFTATIDDYEDEATPAVPALGPVPLWKDGDFWIARTAIGGSSLNVDLGLRSAYPPNPNFPEGSEGGELVESRTTADIDIQAYRKADFDTLALADAQAQHAVFAQWGYTGGNIVQVVIPQARFNYQSPQMGGEFISQRGQLFVDVFDKNLCINFPYPLS